MKQFRDLFLKPAPQYFRRLKFNPINPLLLPLEADGLFTPLKMNAPSWHIEQIDGAMSVYFHHLIPPQNNRVNTRFNIDKYIGQGVEEPTLQKTLHCRPQDPRSSLEHFLVGLHDNHVISIMAIPKTGNNLKLCQALSGTETLPDLTVLDNPDLANQFSYQFAAKAGADPRARACLVVRCDNSQDIERTEAFFKGVHRFSPFDSSLMTLIGDIIVQSKERIPLAVEIDALIKEKNEFVIPEQWIGATYSQQIKDELTRISQEVDTLKKRANWRVPTHLIKKPKLNLFAGYPNGIPDCQHNSKEILTYNPMIIKDLSEQNSEIFESILSGDYELFKKIVSRNPLVIYERDFHGYLPIEVAYQTMQIRMGADLYNIWVELPKSQQWASQIFFETANKFSDIEYSYGLVLDESYQANLVRNFFSTELPMLEQPLAIYKAITQEDDLNLPSLVKQETSKWDELRQLCIEGNTIAARTVFAEFLPRKFAVFSAHLKSSWEEIADAIEDYFPNIIGLDSAISDGDWEAVALLRQEPVLRDWQELQSAIDKAALVPEIRKKINEIMYQINQLEDPISKNRDELEHLNQNLKKLHDEQTQHLLLYEKVRKEITSSQWNIKERNASFKYVEWLKEKIRKKTLGKTNQDSLKISTDLMGKELNQFNELLRAIKEKDSNKLKEFCKAAFKEPSPLVLYFKSVLHYGVFKVESLSPTDLVNGIMPEHFDLYYALFNNDLTVAVNYIDHYLLQKESVLAHLENKAKAFLNSRIAKRPALHQRVIQGENLPIEQYIAEKKNFDEYKANIQKVLQEQCKLLNELLDTVRLESLDSSFVKTVHQDIHITQSLDELVIKYMNIFVLDEGSIEPYTKEFELEYNLFNNPDSEKKALLSIWHKILAIKLNGIRALTQLTKDYQKLSLCTNERIFQVYTLTLINQQASIIYEHMLKKPREQHFNTSLIALIKRTIKECTSEIEKGKFSALEACSNVGAKMDRRLNSLIKSSLLSYEGQDPWGYTPLLLAVVNNNLELVRSFFENGLASDWIAPLNRTDFKFFTLLSHATSRQMTALLLNYYTDPNTKFIFNEQLERNLSVLLMYHYEQTMCLDTHNQSLLDYIASGHPYDPEHIKELLKHKDKYVQEGPYDPSMPLTVQKAFLDHNESISKRQIRFSNRPKIVSIGGFFQGAGIRTGYSMSPVRDNSEHFYSVLKKVNELNALEQKTLALIFAANFEYLDDVNSQSRCIEFFNKRVLTNQNYTFELIYQAQSEVPIGFFCFQMKLIDHALYGRFMVAHFSLAACDAAFADKGLLSAPFKIILALKKCSDDLGIPFKYYARFARPGVAYLMFARKGSPSPKYQHPKAHTHFIAGLFGNVIEEDGSSIPPVYSKAKINGTSNSQLDEFNFLLDELLHANERSSLPYIVEVNDELTREWQCKLAESSGLTEQHVSVLYEQLKKWIVDDKGLAYETFGDHSFAH